MFEAMLEALVFFKIIFDLVLEVGMLLWRAIVALIQLFILMVKGIMKSSNRKEDTDEQEK